MYKLTSINLELWVQATENIKVCTLMKVKWVREAHASYREGQRSVFFCLSYVVHKCLWNITMYTVFSCCPGSLTAVYALQLTYSTVFWVGNYEYLFFSNSVFLHLNNTTFITTLWNYIWQKVFLSSMEKDFVKKYLSWNCHAWHVTLEWMSSTSVITE
jgi:hypothetical protein